jgi:hypothetical protein
MKSISEEFRRFGDWYNIKTVFKTRHTLMSILRCTRLGRDLQNTAHCVYSIPCECGRNHIGDTSRPVAICNRKPRHNLKEGLLEKSRLAQHAFEEDHCIGCNKVNIMQTENNSRYRKCKEAAHMACSTNPISQASLEVSLIWIPVIRK